MKQYTGIIFDMDGTLFDTEALSLTAWGKAAERYGIEISADYRRAFIGLSRTSVLTRLTEDFPADTPVEKIFDYHIEYAQMFIKEHGVPLKNSVKEVLTALQGRDYRLALATSSARVHTEDNLKAAKIHPMFETIVCGDDICRSKPDPQIYLETARRLDLKPSACLAVEDSPNGIRSAYSAGIDVVMIPDIIQPDAEMKSKSAYILNCLEELLKVV